MTDYRNYIYRLAEGVSGEVWVSEDEFLTYLLRQSFRHQAQQNAERSKDWRAYDA